MPARRRSSKDAPSLYHAITGDMIGCFYEFRMYNVFKREDVELFRTNRNKESKNKKQIFTDDSVLTIAVANAVRESRGKKREEKLAIMSRYLKEYYKKYTAVEGNYGQQFVKWAENSNEVLMENDPQFNFSDGTGYKSDGDGSAMRICAIANAFGTLKEVLEWAEISALPSHSSKEAIMGAQAVAAAAYLARAGRSKQEIKLYIESQFGYDLDKPLEAYRNYNHDGFTGSNQTQQIQTTAPMAIKIFLESDGYLDAITNTMAVGGDSDTVGSMVGVIAGCAWGMPRWMGNKCSENLDDYLDGQTKSFESFLDTVDTEPDQSEIEVALAKSKLDKHILDQHKAGKKVSPQNDEKYFDLLVELEAARVFYDKVNEARDNNDELTEQALKHCKKTVIDSLKNEIRENERFKAGAAAIPESVVREDTFRDPDKGKRNKKVLPLFDEKIARVDHDKIPEKFVENSLFDGMIESTISTGKTFLEEKAKLKERVEKVRKAQIKASQDPNAPDVVKTEEYYDNILEAMTGEAGKFFPDGVPGELADIMEEFKKLKASHQTFELQDFANAVEVLKTFPQDDPVKLSEVIQDKLEKLSENMLFKAKGDNEKELDQIAFVSRLSDAVGKLHDAPVKEEDVYEYDKEKLGEFRTKLKNACTGYDSSEYKYIISQLKKLREPDAKAENYTQLFGGKRDTPRSAQQEHVAKLFSLQRYIDNYIDHKSRDGVNKNTYHKLAAVEELSQYLTKRILQLDPKPFRYFGNVIPNDLYQKPLAAKVTKAELADSVNAAVENGTDTYVEECRRTLNCMEKIVNGSLPKKKDALKIMQEKFLKEPGPTETEKVKTAEPVKAGVVVEAPKVLV